MSGIIRKITENELVGGIETKDVYPVTSIKAVYDETNTSLDKLLFGKLGKDSVAQESGESITDTMSQGAITNFVKVQQTEVKEVIDEDIKAINQRLDQKITANQLDPSVYEALGSNNTNIPDDEDLYEEKITENTGVLKLKDRKYVANSKQGKGSKILRMNIVGGINMLTQEMVNEDNTVYDIRYDYDLQGETIQLNKLSICNFSGGSFSNGTININGAVINNPNNAQIFNNVNFVGYTNIEYVTPSWFGAVGDGVADDTEALRKAFWFSHTTQVPLLIDAGIYLVSAPMNYRNGDYADMSVNLRGRAPSMLGEYAVTRYGGIKLTTDTHLFEGARIKGSMHNISITGKREENIHIFSNCQVGRMIIRDSNFSNIGAMFYNSSLVYVSQVVDCSFQTCFWFSRVVGAEVSCTDSVIKGCYINGGEEPTNNSCFEWSYFNGSTVINNFIDFYRCIYHPKSNVTQAFQGGISVGNQYQVFRYFIYPFESNFGSYSFNSSADCFNWVDPASLAKLQTYEPLSDKFGIELPPYICVAQETTNIIMNDVIIQTNVGDYGLYIQDQISNYEIGKCVFKSNRNIPIKLREDKGTNPNVFYNNGQYNLTNSIDTNCYVEVSELPFGALGWSAIPLGYKAKFKGELYEFKALSTDSGTKVVEWCKINNAVTQVMGGTTAQRPTSPTIYSEYFDTTLSKPIYWTGSKWVDSQGTDV